MNQPEASLRERAITIPETDRDNLNHKISIENESGLEELPENGQRKGGFSGCLAYFLTLVFLCVIGFGIWAFYRYDRQFKTDKAVREEARADSINSLEKSITSRRLAEQAYNDSVLDAEFRGIYEADSMENQRKIVELRESRRQDSIRVDTFMTHVIKSLSASNVILARYLDGVNYIYYYTNPAASEFNISCFDGVSKQAYQVISNISGHYVDHFVTPDFRSLIVMCKNNKRKTAFAYKINMSANTYVEYNSIDEEGLQCFDVARDSNGFYMKFGNKANGKNQLRYMIYYDRYGNFISQKEI